MQGTADSTIIDDCLIVLAQQQASHNERVAAVAEARRKRETSGHHASSNGGVRPSVIETTKEAQRHENIIRSMLKQTPVLLVIVVIY